MTVNYKQWASIITISLIPICSWASNNLSWNKIEGGGVVEGQYSIKCGSGSGWQKCGEKEYNCVFDDKNQFVFSGSAFSAPSFSQIYPSNDPPSDFNALPYSWPLKSGMYFHTINGKEYSGSSGTLVVNRLDRVSESINFATMFVPKNENVELQFRQEWGDMFLDMSALRLPSSDGKIIFPGRLREVYRWENGQVIGGIKGNVWYKMEICKE